LIASDGERAWRSRGLLSAVKVMDTESTVSVRIQGNR
jgi:hypothetical protein